MDHIDDNSPVSATVVVTATATTPLTRNLNRELYNIDSSHRSRPLSTPIPPRFDSPFYRHSQPRSFNHHSLKHSNTINFVDLNNMNLVNQDSDSLVHRQMQMHPRPLNSNLRNLKSDYEIKYLNKRYESDTFSDSDVEYVKNGASYNQRGYFNRPRHHRYRNKQSKSPKQREHAASANNFNNLTKSNSTIYEQKILPQLSHASKEQIGVLDCRDESLKTYPYYQQSIKNTQIEALSHPQKQRAYSSIKPISTVQTNRICNNYTENLKKLNNNNNKSKSIEKENYISMNNYSDLIIENTASFMDSPIHLLMNHHKNQRLLKQQHFIKQNFSLLNTQNEQQDQTLGSVTIQTNVELPQSGLNITQPAEQKSNEKDFLQSKKSKSVSKTFLALLITSMITVSSIYLLEIFSCIIRHNYTHLMFLKLSSCFFSFMFVISMASYHKLKPNIKEKNTLEKSPIANELIHKKLHYYYNIFLSKDYSILEGDCDEEDVEDEEKDLLRDGNVNRRSSTSTDNSVISSSNQRDQLIVSSNAQLNILNDMDLLNLNKFVANNDEINTNETLTINYIEHFLKNSKIRSNFHMIIVSLLMIHFWILSTYLFGYLFSSSSYTISFGSKHYYNAYLNYFLSSLVETLSAIIGGMGTALFFKNIILRLFETSCVKCKFKNFKDLNQSVSSSINVSSQSREKKDENKQLSLKNSSDLKVKKESSNLILLFMLS